MNSNILNNGYEPLPEDISDVVLPKELEELTEIIAKNVHEVWSQGRIDDGWVYGEERDTEKKTTPCLVPYEELSEEEKDFDRRTAMNTLKFIIKAGFKITK